MTQPGFNLNQLIDIYIQQFSPYVKESEDSEPVKAYIVYNRLMKMLNDNKGEKKYREHLEKLVEPSLVVYSPDLYTELDFCLQKNISYWNWKNRPLDERAKTIAVASLSSMVAIINRSDSIVQENKRKAHDKAINKWRKH